MKDSNHTLRWNRTSRDAFGYDVNFNEDKDRWVWWVSVFALGFIAGVLFV